MMKKILKSSEKTLKKGAEIVRQGGVVVFPTETVYGLGTSAFNPKAVGKIFEIKQRPFFDPIIVHVADSKDVRRLCVNVNENVKKLIKRFWPGPLTLVLQKSKIVPDIVTAGLETVAVRMPSHPAALELIRRAEVPIAAPSANLFGCLSPTEVSHIDKRICEKVDLIIDSGKCPIGVESTVLDLSNTPTVLRPGGLPIEKIEKEIGKVEVCPIAEKPRSPGMLKRHYSPKTKLKIIKDKNFSLPPGVKKAGLLAYKQPKYKIKFEKIEVLTPSGDLQEAAVNFFSALHRLDRANLEIIYAEPLPEKGLGIAIMDRLRKAESSESL